MEANTFESVNLSQDQSKVNTCRKFQWGYFNDESISWYFKQNRTKWKEKIRRTSTNGLNSNEFWLWIVISFSLYKFTHQRIMGIACYHLIYVYLFVDFLKRRKNPLIIKCKITCPFKPLEHICSLWLHEILGYLSGSAIFRWKIIVVMRPKKSECLWRNSHDLWPLKL